MSPFIQHYKRNPKATRAIPKASGWYKFISIMWPCVNPGLARIMHEGNEEQGKYGKQGWSIARRFIAVAMDQGGSIKIAYRDCRW